MQVFAIYGPVFWFLWPSARQLIIRSSLRRFEKHPSPVYVLTTFFFSLKTFIEKNIIAMVCRRVHKYGRIKYMNYGFPFLRV